MENVVEVFVREVERENEEEGFFGFLGILELCVKMYMSV